MRQITDCRLQSPSFKPETLKRVLDRMAADAKLDILYHTQFTEPIMDKNRVIGAIIENKGGRQAILAKRVVDASCVVLIHALGPSL